MPSTGRFDRWKRTLVPVGALGAVVAIALVATYAPMPHLTPEPTLSPAFQLTPPRSVNANGSVAGLGGCAAPGTGAIEYCYAMGVVYPPPLTAPLNFSGPGPYEFTNTSAVSFEVDHVGAGGNMAFENVTLLGPSGVLLAGYSPAVGWTAIGARPLPIVVVANDTLVLNFGRAAASGDELVVSEGPWGHADAELP